MMTTATIVSKEEAWKDLPFQRNVPIDHDLGPYHFRRRWFKYRNQTTFSTFLLDKFPSDRPYTMLTIGVFEGAQEVWLMQHVLKHPDSKLFCIDPWHDTGKLDQTFMDEAYVHAKQNLSRWESQINIQRAYSQEIMQWAVNDGAYFGEPLNSFDLVIIDGDHNADPVLVDAKNALAFCKPGGWLLFDDVRNQYYKPDHVQHGLIKFVEQYGNQVRFAWAHRFCDCYEKV